MPLHEIVCNDWFGSVVFISGSRDIHARGFGFLIMAKIVVFFMEANLIWMSENPIDDTRFQYL